MTILFVMLGEVLIYAPSVARFREAWLREKLDAAYLATLALEAAADEMVSDGLTAELLAHVGAYGIVRSDEMGRRRLLTLVMPPKIDRTVYLDRESWWEKIRQSFFALNRGSDRILRVISASSEFPKGQIEVIIDEEPLCAAMLDFSGRILILSVIISLIAAGLIYLSLRWLLVRPMRVFTDNMLAFSEKPEDEARTITPSGRGDEIGIAERQLASLQRQVRASLRQKARLAALGTAVTKINHDLRNILGAASLLSDRLAHVDDPEAKRIAPNLLKTLDRAIALCQRTLDFARSDLPPLEQSVFTLGDLVSDMQGVFAGDPRIRIEFGNDAARHQRLVGDQAQIHRIFTNLVRNAIEAGADCLHVSVEAAPAAPAPLSGTSPLAAVNGRQVAIGVWDNGPGMGKAQQGALFQPFASSAGGSGLGLSICREIMIAHGGDIMLVESRPGRTHFRLIFPAPPAEADPHA